MLNFIQNSDIQDSEKIMRRTVDPYHLFNYMGTWHLLGRCHLRNEMRDFALNRISGAKVMDETCEAPSDFDFKKYFLSTFGLYKGKSIQEVVLRFSPLHLGRRSMKMKGKALHRGQIT